MLINYNSENKSISIKDNAKSTKYILFMIFILNSIGLSINSYSNYLRYGFEGLTLLFAALALASIGVFIYLSVKKTYHNEIKIADIKYLKKSSFLGKNLFSIRLKNRKHRDIQTNFKSASDLRDFKKIFNDLEISIK